MCRASAARRAGHYHDARRVLISDNLELIREKKRSGLPYEKDEYHSHRLLSMTGPGGDMRHYISFLFTVDHAGFCVKSLAHEGSR